MTLAGIMCCGAQMMLVEGLERCMVTCEHTECSLREVNIQRMESQVSFKNHDPVLQTSTDVDHSPVFIYRLF